MTAFRYRGAFVTALSCIVVALLAISFASIGRTSGYTLFSADTGRRAGSNVAVAFAAVGDRSERIRIVLHAVPRGADEHAVPVVGSTARYRMVPTQKDTAKSLQLAVSALLFAAFGFVVLWWGTDRASFWLGTSCVALAPELVTLYGFVPEPLMLVCRIAADLLTFLSFYGLYAMADAVARDALRGTDPVRRPLGALRAGVVVVLVAGAAANAGALLLPVFGGTTLPGALARLGTLATTIAWSLVFCVVPPGLLALGAARAASPERARRSRVMLVATLAGVSGLAFSIAGELARGTPPHFETLWFTLLLIPVGFMVAIRAFGVIELQVIINRILVVSAMTLVIGLALQFAEELVRTAVEEWIKPDESQRREFDAIVKFVVGFIIVLGFGKVHHRLEETFRKLVFRRRDRGISSLRDFSSRRGTTFTESAALMAHTAALVRVTVRTTGTALYRTCADGFELAAHAGTITWPVRFGAVDPLAAALRERAEPIALARLVASSFEGDGFVFRIAVGKQLIGALAVTPRASEGALDGAELAAIEAVARYAGEELLDMRMRDIVTFVDDVAADRLSGADARLRATALLADAHASGEIFRQELNNVGVGDNGRSVASETAAG
ncbi:MAG: hypothetical protein NVS3B16_25090 [Vulcanimicrobiaceae bacterium]